MLPNPDSLRQVEGQKGLPQPARREGVDAPGHRRSLREQPAEEDKDKLGIEDADPRWSKRELVLKRTEVPPGPEAPPRLANDATDFRGQPADPFEVLIKRREEHKKRQQRSTRDIAVKLETGLAQLDQVLDGLEPRLYAIVGTGEPARSLAHQLACGVAAEHPVVFVSSAYPARDLTLRALARLAGDRAPGDLARARDLADAYRPVHDNTTVVEGSPDETAARLRIRLQQALARRQERHGLLAIDDLAALVTPDAPPPPQHRPTLGEKIRAEQANRAPAGRVPGPAATVPEPASELTGAVPAAKLDPAVLQAAFDLARVAEQVRVPVLAVLPADPLGPEMPWPADLPEPVRIILPDVPYNGGAVEAAVLKPRGPAAPPVVHLTYRARRSAFD